MHATKAGLHADALHQLYFPRLLRGDEAWCLHWLGAYDSDAARWAGFFDGTWERPIATLDDEDTALVLSGAGFDLRALGRLHESLQVVHAALRVDVAREDVVGCAIHARNIAQLYLLLGQLDNALRYARLAVDYADRASHHHERMVERTTLAYVLHYRGDGVAAERMFLEAETIQRDNVGGPRRLYSIGAARLVDLLIDSGRFEEAIERSREAIAMVAVERSLLDLGLNKINESRALRLSQGRAALSASAGLLSDGMSALRASYRTDYLPTGLLAVAEHHCWIGELSGAMTSLDEAFEIIARCKLQVFEVDWHVSAARLRMATDGTESQAGSETRAPQWSASEHLRVARDLAQALGYRRRLPEIERLAEAIPRGGS